MTRGYRGLSGVPESSSRGLTVGPEKEGARYGEGGGKTSHWGCSRVVGEVGVQSLVFSVDVGNKLKK